MPVVNRDWLFRSLVYPRLCESDAAVRRSIGQTERPRDGYTARRVVPPFVAPTEGHEPFSTRSWKRGARRRGWPVKQHHSPV